MWRRYWIERHTSADDWNRLAAKSLSQVLGDVDFQRLAARISKRLSHWKSHGHESDVGEVWLGAKFIQCHRYAKALGGKDHDLPNFVVIGSAERSS